MKSKVLSYKVASKMQFILNNKSTDIPEDGIKSIIINHNYKNNIMPYIIITLNINNKLYNDMTTNWKTGKIFLNIQIFDSHLSSIRIDKIKDQFIYFLPNDSNYLKDLDINTNNIDQSFKRITIGLMKAELLNFNKKIFNGVQTNITNNELLSLFTEGRPLIHSELNNKVWDQILIPPLSSRSDAIRYLVSYGDIFDTEYMYFMDFDKSYLLDMKEKMISKADNNKYNTIIIDIGNINIISENYDGIVKDIDNNCYIMYLNVADTDLSINKNIDKLTTELISVVDDGSSSVIKLDIEKSKFSKDKSKFVRRENSSIKLKNSIEKNKVVLNISKLNLDSSLITPDRIYIVKNYKDYTEYNGKYILLYKKEIIVKTDDSFTTNTLMGFCKID